MNNGKVVPDNIEERLNVLLDSTQGIRLEIAKENKKRGRREIMLVVAIVLVLLIGVGGVLVGRSGSNEARKADKRALEAKSALAAYLKNRDSSRVASCQQYNLQQASQRDAEIAQSHDLVEAIAKAIPAGPERDNAVKVYNDRHDALIRGEHQDRDCSAAGIKKYLAATTTASV